MFNIPIIPTNPLFLDVFTREFAEKLNADLTFKFLSKHELKELRDKDYELASGKYILSILKTIMSYPGIDKEEIERYTVLEGFDLWKVVRTHRKKQLSNNTIRKVVDLLKGYDIINVKIDSHNKQKHYADEIKAKEYALNLLSWKYTKTDHRERASLEQIAENYWISRIMLCFIEEQPNVWNACTKTYPKSREKQYELFAAVMNGHICETCLLKNQKIVQIKYEISHRQKIPEGVNPHEYLSQAQTHEETERIFTYEKDKKPLQSAVIHDSFGAYCKECGKQSMIRNIPISNSLNLQLEQTKAKSGNKTRGKNICRIHNRTMVKLPDGKKTCPQCGLGEVSSRSLAKALGLI